MDLEGRGLFGGGGVVKVLDKGVLRPGCLPHWTRQVPWVAAGGCQSHMETVLPHVGGLD